MSTNKFDYNYQYVKHLDSQIEWLRKEVETVERLRCEHLHGKRYGELVLQKQKMNDGAYRMRVYKKEGGKKKYFTFPRFTPIKAIADKCKEILK